MKRRVKDGKNAYVSSFSWIEYCYHSSLVNFVKKHSIWKEKNILLSELPETYIIEKNVKYIIYIYSDTFNFASLRLNQGDDKNC